PRHDTLELLITALGLSVEQAAVFRSAGRRNGTGSLTEATGPQSGDAPFIPRNPYKGLRAFREEDAGDFFGRHDLIAALLTALTATSPALCRFLAVVGPSGSGKSSLVMAGLLPRLRQGALPDSEGWMYLDPILPGAHPLESLTIAL